MDEQLDIIDGLCAGGFFEYHGAVLRFAPVKICPVPNPRIPILVGGHAPAALERAARWDGWLHAGSEQRAARRPGGVRAVDAGQGSAGSGSRSRSMSISTDGYSVAVAGA